MKMPNKEQATIDDGKIMDYLLNDSHLHGKHKAQFFKRFGFDAPNAHALKESLILHAITRDIAKTEKSIHGVKYILECEIETPDLRNPCITSVWIIEEGSLHPRLITAYPNQSSTFH